MTRVFTNGCYDIVHGGHIHTLRAAREMGDSLVVAINSDESVRRLKGESRPLVPLADRIAVLRELRMIDEVIPFWEDTPQKVIEALRPDVIVKGAEWYGKPVAGENIAELRLVENVSGFSTTQMVAKIISLYKSGVIKEDGTSR